MSKEQVSKGQDFSVSRLDRAHLGREKEILSVEGASGDFVVKDLSGAEVLKVDARSGEFIVNGQAAIGTTGTDLSLSGDLVVSGDVAADLQMGAGFVLGLGAPQALSGAGACNVSTLVTNFTSSGPAQALSLADGSVVGQLKVVHHTVDGGSGVLTPVSAGNFATFTLTNVHDACLLQWSGSAWNLVIHQGGTVA